MTRRILFTFLFAAGLLSADDLTLDQILQKHYDAMGGLDAMKAIKSVVGTGKAQVMGQYDMTITVKQKRPNMMRQDMEFNAQKLVQAYDGTTAWSINPFAGGTDPQKMPETEAQQYIDSADMDGPLVDYKAKGNTVELLGKEDVEGSPAYKVKVTRKNGRTETFWLDASTFLAIKSLSKVNMGGQEMEVESMPGNYKKVNGVMEPFSLEQKMGGRSFISLTIDKYEANVSIDDAEFKMPPPKPPEEKKN